MPFHLKTKLGSDTGTGVKNSPDGEAKQIVDLPPLLRLNRKKTLIGASIVIILVLSYYALSLSDANSKKTSAVSVNGRIETTETRIVAATGTRVKAVLVKEGESVKKGQLLIELDSQSLEQKIGMAGNAIGKARLAEREANRQVAIAQSEINQARKQSKGLFAKIFTTKKGRAKKERELRGQMMQAKMMQMQAKGFVSQAQTARSQAQSRVSFFRLTSPVDGIVTTRSTQPGELVAQGQVLITISDPKSSYMRGFISEGDLARLSVGQNAEVYLLSDSSRAFEGKVSAIDPEPSFTPQNVYFKDDKIRQSFGLKIAIENPDGRAKPGMEAEARIALGQGKGD